MFPLVISVSEVEVSPISVAKSTTIQVLISPSAAGNFIMRRIVINAGDSMPNHTNLVESPVISHNIQKKQIQTSNQKTK